MLDDHEVTHVVHLAAMLSPRFRANPRRGTRVNVLGGVSLFEAAAARLDRIQRIVFASSIAVYGPDGGAAEAVGHGAVGRPATLYGVFKQAEEGMARVFWQDRGLSSIGLRPATAGGRPGGRSHRRAHPGSTRGGAWRALPHRLRRPQPVSVCRRHRGHVHRLRPQRLPGSGHLQHEGHGGAYARDRR